MQVVKSPKPICGLCRPAICMFYFFVAFGDFDFFGSAFFLCCLIRNVFFRFRPCLVLLSEGVLVWWFGRSVLRSSCCTVCAGLGCCKQFLCCRPLCVVACPPEALALSKRRVPRSLITVNCFYYHSRSVLMPLVEFRQTCLIYTRTRISALGSTVCSVVPPA